MVVDKMSDTSYKPMAPTVILVITVLVMVILFAVIIFVVASQFGCPYRLCEDPCPPCQDCRCPNNEPDCIPCEPLIKCPLTCEEDCPPPTCEIKNVNLIGFMDKNIKLSAGGYLNPDYNGGSIPVYTTNPRYQWRYYDNYRKLCSNEVLGNRMKCITRYNKTPNNFDSYGVRIDDTYLDQRRDSDEWFYDGYNFYFTYEDQLYILAYNSQNIEGSNVISSNLYVLPVSEYMGARRGMLIVE